MNDIVHESALKDLHHDFNNLAFKHGLNAMDAVTVCVTHCAKVIADQRNPQADIDAFVLKQSMNFRFLLRFYIGRKAEIDNPVEKS